MRRDRFSNAFFPLPPTGMFPDRFGPFTYVQNPNRGHSRTTERGNTAVYNHIVSRQPTAVPSGSFTRYISHIANTQSCGLNRRYAPEHDRLSPSTRRTIYARETRSYATGRQRCESARARTLHGQL